MKLFSEYSTLSWFAACVVFSFMCGCPADDAGSSAGSAGSTSEYGDGEAIAGTLSPASPEQPASPDDVAATEPEVGEPSADSPVPEERSVTQEGVPEPPSPAPGDSSTPTMEEPASVESPSPSVEAPTPVCATSEFEAATYSEPIQAGVCLAVLFSDNGPYSCRNSSDGRAVVCVWGVEGVGLVLERIYGPDGIIAYLEVSLVEPNGVQQIGDTWQASNGHYLSELHGKEETFYIDCAVSGFTVNVCSWSEPNAD